MSAVWRRLAAITYDALLLAGLWMAAAMAMTFLAPDHPLLLRVVTFSVGLGFFGWFWTHGGQTLGMRVWRVRVERADGSALRAPIALLRYLAGLLPIVTALYLVATRGWIASPIALVGYAPCFFDRERRAFNDLVAGTRVVVVEPRASAQGAQAQQRDEHEQRGGQAG